MDLHEQNNPTYHKLLAAGPVSVVPVYTPGGCTDLVAVIDDPAIGKTEKDLIKKRFRADFMARPDQYCNGDVKPAEFRTLLVTWTKGARMEFMDAHSSSIKYAFQRKGMLNAIDGSENHLIQIEGFAAGDVDIHGNEPPGSLEAAMMRHARRQKPKRGHPNLNRVYDVDFPPIEDECTGSASGSDDASAGSDGESGDTQDIVVMSGDGGRDEAHECDSSYQGSPNFSDSNGAEGAGHGDDKEEGHDRDGSDEAGDGHRLYRHPHFRPGY